MKYVIFDLDNCLADDSARLPLIDHAEARPTERYAAYHAGCGNDPVGNYTTFTLACHAARPIFLTARPVSVHAQTLLWIQDNLGVQDPILIMRNVHDHRPSPALKGDQLRSLDAYGVDLADIICAFDDREDVLAMYAEHGLSTCRLAIHAVSCENPRAPDILAAGAETFRQRNKVYGDNYLAFGALMAALYPAGLHASAPDSFTRLGLIVMCASKLSRYVSNPQGHKDSAHDLMVYAAMLEECTP